MKERGMIFNGEMVRALLNGSKTQTRRLAKIGRERGFDGPVVFGQEGRVSLLSFTPGVARCCPFGGIGDRIWVRETWQAIFEELGDDGDVDETTYAPSIPKEKDNYWCPVFAADNWTNDREERGFPWRPAIHMPRWASRIVLEIISVRVERLSAISEGDAAAEGITTAGNLLPDYPGTYMTPKGDFATAQVAFQRLWESIYGEESWKANPWVWVIEFKRVEATDEQ